MALTNIANGGDWPSEYHKDSRPDLRDALTYEQNMISLFEFYGYSFPMVWVKGCEGKPLQLWHLRPEALMFVKAVVTMLFTAGVAFYVRFMVALRPECKPRSSGDWPRLRVGSGADPLPEIGEPQRTVAGAA